jgi:hypothetical protein
VKAGGLGGGPAARRPPPTALPDDHLRTIRVVERRPPYLLIARHGRFAVVERRNGKLYNPHCGRRAPGEITDVGALAVVGQDWCDERMARRLFDEIATRYTNLAERLW